MCNMRIMLHRARTMPHIHHLESCDSTMNEARALARSGAGAFTTVWADEQTAGRGRQGRAWQSARGAGVYVTVILPGMNQISLAPLLVGVAITEAIRFETGVQAALKWPNDVLAPDGRKLAGVLLERDAQSGVLLAGFGVNIQARDFGDLPAVGLEALVEQVDRQRLLEAILERLETLSDQPEMAILERWRALNQTLGRDVLILNADGSSFHGVALDLEPNGALRVQTETGIRIVSSAEVSLRFPNP